MNLLKAHHRLLVSFKHWAPLAFYDHESIIVCILESKWIKSCDATPGEQESGTPVAIIDIKNLFLCFILTFKTVTDCSLPPPFVHYFVSFCATFFFILVIFPLYCPGGVKCCGPYFLAEWSLLQLAVIWLSFGLFWQQSECVLLQIIL